MDNYHILDVDSRDERCQTDTGVKVIVKEICGLDHPTDMQKLEKEQRDDVLRQLCLIGGGSYVNCPESPASVVGLTTEQKVDRERTVSVIHFTLRVP